MNLWQFTERESAALHAVIARDAGDPVFRGAGYGIKEPQPVLYFMDSFPMLEKQMIPARGVDDYCNFEPDIGVAVGDFPRFEYRVDDVKLAGKMLAGDLLWDTETKPKIEAAFQVANNWRDSHAYPMRSVRYQIIWFLRENNLQGVTAARLKRMQAIRRKLRRFSYHLGELQDLGGCRAILNSIADVRSLVAVMRERSRHHLREEDDYILRPKKDGYRSHHLMFDYRGKAGAAIYDNRRIEVQIRTQLQHSWATAVEAVGLFRREELKSNRGSAEWLRLFKLMSAEFAFAEGCNEPPDVPIRNERVAEIKALEGKLDAANILGNLSYAVRATEVLVQPSVKPRYYLIKFDNATKEVIVEPYFAPRDAVLSYDNAESFDNESGKDASNIVLVEADKLENLKTAYPNYFGDVHLFRSQLNRIVKGKDAIEYTVREQDRVVQQAKEIADTSWFHRKFRLK